MATLAFAFLGKDLELKLLRAPDRVFGIGAYALAPLPSGTTVHLGRRPLPTGYAFVRRRAKAP